MTSDNYTVQMTIAFSRTKDFKKSKSGFAFHPIIEKSIADIKPDGNGPINERIKNPTFRIFNSCGKDLECKLSVQLSSFDEHLKKLIIELMSNLKKNFSRWGKYKIHIKDATVIQNIDKVNTKKL